MQPGQDSEELGWTKVQAGGRSVQCARKRGQCLAHSLRTRRLGRVPARVQPLPVGLNTGNEAKWMPVEVGTSESKK